MDEELETFRLLRQALTALRDAPSGSARRLVITALIAGLTVQVGLSATDGDYDNDGVPDVVAEGRPAPSTHKKLPTNTP